MMERVNIVAFVYTKSPNPFFLLLKRIPEKGGFWQPISGGIEKNETPIQALKRELAEETGIVETIGIIDLKFSYLFEAEKQLVNMKMKDICYGVEVQEITPIMLSSEHSRYKWCTPEEVDTYLDWKYSRLAFEKLVTIIH